MRIIRILFVSGMLDSLSHSARCALALCVQAFGGLTLIAFLALPAQTASATPSGWSPVSIPAARQQDMTSRATGHRYRIFIATPSGEPPPQGYPVFYVLDGNAAFPIAALLSRTIANRRKVTGHVPPIVVGIGYPGDRDFDVAARRRDYTVAAAESPASASEGGAALLLDFIENELKPMIAEQHRIDPRRQALFGHSFGGLFVLHAMLNRPAVFSTYLISSPSIWWRDKVVLNDLPKLANTTSAGVPRVQITVGSREDEPREGNPEVQALLAKRPIIADARNLVARLKEMPGGHSQLAYHELAGEDHGFVWLPAMSRGLQYFLEQP